MNESDPLSNVHYWSSGENKACMGFEPMHRYRRGQTVLCIHAPVSQRSNCAVYPVFLDGVLTIGK